LLVNSIKRGSDLITTALILPMAMTPILVGLIWKMLLDPTLGWIPYIFSLVGIKLPPLLASHQTALATVIFVDIWQWTPFMTLLLYAGLRSLPIEPFEAAQLDGASRRHTLQYIIIPGLMPIIAIALAFRVIDSLNFFDVMFIMTGGGPGTSTESINYYAYKTGFSWGNMSYATSIAIVMLYVLVLISQVLFRIAKPQRRE